VEVTGVGNADDVSAGAWHTCSISALSKELNCWGDNRFGQLGGGDSIQYEPTEYSEQEWQQVACGMKQTCGIDKAQGIWCWGSLYQVVGGEKKSARTESPRAYGLDESWISVDTAGTQNCALSIDGKIHCWGPCSIEKNDGCSSIGSEEPSVVFMSRSWESVVVDSGGACGISEGEIYCWGSGVIPNLAGKMYVAGELVYFGLTRELGTSVELD
jgi:alpha-tubulin suppressor-like RCC1 family protein